MAFSFKNIFKRRQKASRSAMAVVGNYQTSYPERNYENYAKEAFLKNAIVFRCVDLISKSVASVPWGLFEERADGEIEKVQSDPMYELLYRPNVSESWGSFMYGLTAYIPLNGNVMLQRVAPETGPNRGKPRELYVHTPAKFAIKEDYNGNKSAYVMNPNTATEKVFPIDPITGDCDIRQIKLFNPINTVWGTAITEAAGREIDSSNSAIDWNKSLLDNQARPGMVLTSEHPLSDQQFERLSQQIREEREGAVNAGKTLILEGLNKAEPYGFSPAEMDYIEGNREMARRIVTAFGVPPQLIGIKGDQTYANYSQARQSFWEDTVVFYLTLIRDELNHWIFGPNSTRYFDFILDTVPAFDDKRTALWDRVIRADFMTVNEKRQAVGMDEIDGGDVLLIPATMIPIGSEADTEPAVDDNNNDDEL